MEGMTYSDMHAEVGDTDEWAAIEDFIDIFGKARASPLDGDGVFASSDGVAMLVADSDGTPLDLDSISSVPASVGRVPADPTNHPDSFGGATVLVRDGRKTYIKAEICEKIARYTGSTLKMLDRSGLCFVHPDGNHPIRLLVDPFTLVISPVVEQ